MSSRSERQQLGCDAPPYVVVKACEELSFHSPLYVRWCHMSHVLARRSEVSELLGFRAWEWIFGKDQPPDRCACGQRLPSLERYQFAFTSGRTAAYFLGQCSRCDTIFWDIGTVDKHQAVRIESDLG